MRSLLQAQRNFPRKKRRAAVSKHTQVSRNGYSFTTTNTQKVNTSFLYLYLKDPGILWHCQVWSKLVPSSEIRNAITCFFLPSARWRSRDFETKTVQELTADANISADDISPPPRVTMTLKRAGCRQGTDSTEYRSFFLRIWYYACAVCLF
jgi:hypothetical protein